MENTKGKKMLGADTGEDRRWLAEQEKVDRGGAK